MHRGRGKNRHTNKKSKKLDRHNIPTDRRIDWESRVGGAGKGIGIVGGKYKIGRKK